MGRAQEPDRLGQAMEASRMRALRRIRPLSRVCCYASWMIQVRGALAQAQRAGSHLAVGRCQRNLAEALSHRQLVRKWLGSKYGPVHWRCVKETT